MHLTLLRVLRREPILLVVTVIALVAAFVAVAVKDEEDAASRRTAGPTASVSMPAAERPVVVTTPAPDAASPSAPATAVAGDAPAAGARVAVTTRPVVVRRTASPGAARVSGLRAGIPLPLGRGAGDFVAVQTPCEYGGWVEAASLRDVPAGDGAKRPRPFERATLVLDPGHGGPAPGATGPGGLTESEVNLDIVRRLALLLSEPRDVDAVSGSITRGSRHGVPQVVLTRDSDTVAGLAYRAALANAMRPDAFVSVHNNAQPDGPSARPGTETYYQLRSPESKRLAGLAYEEVFRALAAFEGVSWMADRDAGAKYRTNDRGTDFYGLLRRSQVPSVIVEAAFVSNASEEALLRRPEVRQAIADALYRALVRFVTTEDAGSGFVEPYPRTEGSTGALPSRCIDPA